MTGDDMTDEEYGRAWGARYRYSPAPAEDGWVCWSRYRPTHITDSKAPNGVPMSVWVHLGAPDDRRDYYQTEADAYTALGRAIRAVHQAVPHLKGDE